MSRQQEIIVTLQASLVTTAKRAMLIAVWTVLPRAAKGALYRKHRAKIQGRMSVTN